MSEKNNQEIKRTAGEAGWHLSRYNLSAPVPGKDAVAIANLFKGTCAEYSPLELYLLSVLDRLDEHPAWENDQLPGEFTIIAYK